MEEFSDLNFKHYVNLFTDSGDELSLQDLYLLKERYPNFDFSKYKVGIFTIENIEKFGEEFLIENYDWLNMNILELDSKKIDYVAKNRRFIIFDARSLKKLTVDELNRINEIKDQDVFALLGELSKDSGFNKILQELLNKMEVISFIAKNFEDVYSEYTRKKTIKFILDEESQNCIEIIDKSYVTTSCSLQNFLKSFFSCKKTIAFSKNNKNSFCDLLFINHVLKLDIKTEEDLNNYFYLKIEKVSANLTEDINSNRDLISKLYFNVDYSVLKNALLTARKCGIFEKYTQFLDLTTKEDFLSFIDLIKFDTNIYYDIEKELSYVSKKSICDSIRPTQEPNNGIVLLNGCDFSFLVHSIKGFANINQANLLADNPALWHANPKEDSYISASYISSDFMGMNDSKSYILGFNSISEEDILYAGLGDIYSTTKQVRNGLRNSRSSCVLASDLRFNSRMAYNEVTLKRIRNGTILDPDFILSLDKITSKDEEAAKYFKVPIYLLDRMKYASRMNMKLEMDLLKDDLDSYILNLRRMFFSFCNCDKIFLEYFSAEKLEINTLRIIRKYIGSNNLTILKKIEEIINMYDNLIISYNFYKEAAIEYDKKRYVNMLKK